MSSSRVLRSKLMPPTLHEDSIERPRLVQRLRDADAALWLVSAPAGYGKSTLVVQALQGFAGHVGWVSLDRVDNDAVRFWAHVAAAVIADATELDRVLELVDPDNLSTTIDELVANIEQHVDPVIVVFDDLHEISNREITDAISRILTHPPDNLTIAVTARADPTLPISRLRARGRLVELRARDLTFTTEEAGQLLGTGVEALTIERIVATTEGWPTALRMLAVSTTTDRSAGDLLEAAAQGGPDLSDFLASEALSVQRDEVQQFLIETSILDDLDPAMCDAVTGRPSSLSMLRDLANRQVFTELVNPITNTFRYHRLFRDFLRSRAEELDPTRLKALHRAAAVRYDEHNNPTPAIRHAMAAGEDSMALQTLKRHYITYSQMGRLPTVMEWLELYGLERARTDSVLRRVAAWGFLNARRYEVVDEWLNPPHPDDPAERDRFLAEAGTICSHRARHLGQLDEAVRFAEEADRLLVDRDDLLATAVDSVRAIALVLAGEQAEEASLAAVTVGNTLQIDAAIMIGYSCLAYLAVADPDRTDEADALADQALAFITSPLLERFHQPALALLVKSQVALARGLPADATELADRGEVVARAGSEPLIAALIHCQQARIDHLQGRLDDSRARLRQADVAAGDHGGRYIADVIRRTRNDTRFAAVDDQHLPPGAIDLSARELAVLQLLPHRLPRRKLAAQLHISENTLKSHLASIRHKLGVVGRSDIVERARELDLLEKDVS